MVSSETQVVQSPPTHPEQHWRPSLRLKLLHLDPGQREPHLPAPSHISVTSTLAAHQFSSKPVLNIPAFRPAASRWCAHHARAAPPAVPGQLPFLCYLPGPILGSASPPVKLTFSLPSTLHVSSMILVSCPHIVLGAKKSAKAMKFTLTYLRGGAGRGVDGPGKGGSGLLGIGLRLCTKQDDFQPFKTVFKWSQGRA